MHRLNIDESVVQLAVSVSHAAQECHQDLMKDVVMVQRNVCVLLDHHQSSADKTSITARLYCFQANPNNHSCDINPTTKN